MIDTSLTTSARRRKERKLWESATIRAILLVGSMADSRGTSKRRDALPLALELRRGTVSLS